MVSGVRDFEASSLLPFLQGTLLDVRKAARAIIVLNTENVHFRWCSLRLSGGVDSDVLDVSDVSVADALAALGPLPTAGMQYACKKSTVGSAFDYPLQPAPSPTAAGVAGAVVAALCENARMKDGGRCLVQRSRPSPNNLLVLVDVMYRKSVDNQAQVLFSHGQIQGLLEAAVGAPPHLIVQYIVTLAAVLCIAEDMVPRAPGLTGRMELCNESLIGPYLDRAHMQYGVHELVEFPSCMDVESTDASLAIALKDADPLRIEVKFAEYPHVPRLMLSMVLLNFMADAALERLPGAPAGASRTPESWTKLVGPPRAVATQGQQQDKARPVFPNPRTRTLLELFLDPPAPPT